MLGRATAAMMTMRATTISSSIMEKPGGGRERAFVLSFMAPPALAIGVPAARSAADTHDIECGRRNTRGPLAALARESAIPSVTFRRGTHLSAPPLPDPGPGAPRRAGAR